MQNKSFKKPAGKHYKPSRSISVFPPKNECKRIVISQWSKRKNGSVMVQVVYHHKLHSGKMISKTCHEPASNNGDDLSGVKFC